MRLFKYIREYQKAVLFNSFIVAIFNSIFHYCFQECWDADRFLWIYFIATLFSSLLQAYSNMKCEN